MSLHDTTEFAKKAGVFLALFLGASLTIFIFVKIGVIIHAILFPPIIEAPNEAYGPLPPMSFPQSNIAGQFIYTINTLSGTLPQDIPDRLNVYQMIISQPDVLNLKNAEQNISNLQFIDVAGNPLTPIPVGGSNYEWRESTPDSFGFERTIDYNTVSQNFTMTSNYLTQISVLQAQYILNLSDPTGAIPIVQTFLSSLNSFPTDVDLTLTQSPTTDETYVTKPQMYSVTNGQLTQTTALATAQVIRVDLYQKEIDYILNGAAQQTPTRSQSFTMQLPIVYPHPPYSTMHFLVASGQSQAVVVSANYDHQSINLQPTTQATYPIISVQQAFDELKSGKAYIASYTGTSNQILITNVYPAYYIGATQQSFLMPVFVFEGQNGFFAYVPAVANSTTQ